MSYCRYGTDGSDLYIYEDTNNRKLCCCGCCFTVAGDFYSGSPAVMLRHVRRHLRQGEHVPQHAIDQLAREAASAKAAREKKRWRGAPCPRYGKSR